ALRVALVAGAEGAGHEMVIACVLAVVQEGGGEVATGSGVLAAFQQDFAESELRLLGSGGGQLAKVRQTAKGVDGVLIASELLKVSPHRQQAIHQIERPAHRSCLPATVSGEVNMFRVGDYNPVPGPSKPNSALRPDFHLAIHLTIPQVFVRHAV